MDPGQVAQKLGPIRNGVRKDLVFTRQVLRGVGRYVAHDPVTFKNHAFDALEYRIITTIVTSRTIAEVFDQLVADEQLAAGDSAEFYGFVLRLHGMDILQLPITDAAILHERYEQKKVARRVGILRAITYLKVPLFDPDRFLDKTVAVFGRLFSRPGFAIWFGLIALSLWKCWGRFGEMFADTGNLLTLANIPVLFITLVVLKAIHEFGHAYACKRFGGEVPEMGLVFILGAPCAYVDASASWKFTSPWHRITVAVGGMHVESMVAAGFALVWAGTQPGLVHDIAVNVLVLASVVTVLFNINPLMRFDGYYVFTDLLGMPNLYHRSNRFVKERAKRLILGLTHADQPLVRRERFLYSTYGFAAVLYKMSLALSIVTMVLITWPLAGTALGLVFAYTMIVHPLIRVERYRWSDRETEPVRARARVVALTTLVVVPLALTLTPLSFSVGVPGILEPESFVVLHAPSDGFVRDVTVQEGDLVHTSQPVIYLTNPQLALDVTAAEKSLRVEEVRLSVAELTHPADVPVHRVQGQLMRARLGRLQSRLNEMQMESPVEGRFAMRKPGLGSFVQMGDEVAEIHTGGSRVRIVLTDAQVGRTELEVGDTVDLRWSVQPEVTVRAKVVRIFPAASRESLPKALTVLGGGEIYGTAGADTELRADRPCRHVILEPAYVPLERTAGLTARVRVPAEVETLGGWVYRRLAEFYRAWRMS